MFNNKLWCSDLGHVGNMPVCVIDLNVCVPDVNAKVKRNYW